MESEQLLRKLRSCHELTFSLAHDIPPKRTATACAHWESNQKKSHFSLSNDAEITHRWQFQKYFLKKQKKKRMSNHAQEQLDKVSREIGIK